jgi:starch-binding outer membrane protein SusE/F
MKNKLFFPLISFTLLMLCSCEKKIDKIFYEGGNPPSLAASRNGAKDTVVLEPGTEANTAIVFQWTNPDYKFTTGLSSQDVSYTLEMDTLGANFSSSKKYITVISRDLSRTFTVGELNGILGNSMVLQLDPRRFYTLQVRVISSISSTVKLTSNVVSIVTKPFAPPPKVQPPASGTLWVTGDAFGDPKWPNPVPPPQDVSWMFTKVSNTLYSLIVHMVGGGGYKVIQQQGNWDTQFHALDNAHRSWSGGDFEQKNSDPTFPGAPDAGNYKITLDFQLGTYTVVKQ